MDAQFLTQLQSMIESTRQRDNGYQTAVIEYQNAHTEALKQLAAAIRELADAFSQKDLAKL